MALAGAAGAPPSGTTALCNARDSPVDCAFINDAIAAWGTNAPSDWHDPDTRATKTLCSLVTISCANSVNISKMCVLG